MLFITILPSHLQTEHDIIEHDLQQPYRTRIDAGDFFHCCLWSQLASSHATVEPKNVSLDALNILRVYSFKLPSSSSFTVQNLKPKLKLIWVRNLSAKKPIEDLKEYGVPELSMKQGFPGIMYRQHVHQTSVDSLPYTLPASRRTLLSTFVTRNCRMENFPFSFPFVF